MSKDLDGQKIKYTIFTLARQVDNRQCADCSASLNESENITYAALSFGVWICQACAVTHRAYLGDNISCTKSIHEKWTREEAEVMKKAGGNAKVNKSLEKYIPDVLTKISPDADDHDREIWIRAKYFAKLFLFPQKKSFLTDENATTNSFTLPSRLADYFLTIGPGKLKQWTSAKSITDSAPEDVILKPFVLNCFPESLFYKDMPIPELLAQFAFPIGIRLSSSSQTPQFFTLVLTDVSGVKVYVSVLVIYELEEPERIYELIGLSKDSEVSPNWSSVYAPKALVVLSHYPFYHLFKVFLEQLYRISLSSSPIPLERYISNFMLEVPLPPTGGTEVVYTLGDKLINLTRSPPNRLPMVDFSYRPLFMSLSVSSIITLFRCLCSECSVCIYSRQLAILTPIQEALLSFLFPFVWQGVYIPILDSTLVDILEAPVPYLVGLHTDLLPDVRRPPQTVLVDVDNDTFFYGESSTPIDIYRMDNVLNKEFPLLSKTEYTKLRNILDLHGGLIYRQPGTGIKTISNPFPNNEQIPAPISESILKEIGVSTNKGYKNTKFMPTSAASSTPGPAAASSYSRMGFASGSATASSSPISGGTSAAQPLACTLVTSKVDDVSERPTSSAFYKLGNFSGSGGGLSSGNNGSGSSNHGRSSIHNGSSSSGSGRKSYKHSLLDPINNVNYGGDEFDAHSIRAAFLKVFVHGFLHYNEYITTTNAKTRGFDRDRFLAKESEPLIRAMVDSQMFSMFIQEKVSNPVPPEITFFDESIIAKHNRSKLSVLKKVTPFLSDSSFDISKSYTCPEPSPWGIQQGQSFTYNDFPGLRKECYGDIRPSHVLVQHPEVRRGSALPTRDNSDTNGTPTDLMSAMRVRERVMSVMTSNVDLEFFEDIEDLLAISFQRYLRAEKAVSSCQRLYRRFRRRAVFRRTRVKVEPPPPPALIAPLPQNKYLKYLPQVVRLQSFARMVIAVFAHHTAMRAVRRMQQWRRAEMLRRRLTSLLAKLTKTLGILRHLIVRRQSLWRGWMTRRRTQRALASQLGPRQAQLFYLWAVEHTALVARAKLWLMIGRVADRSRWVSLALLRGELLRLYRSLGLIADDAASKVAFGRNEEMFFRKRFADVSGHRLLAAIKAALPSYHAQLQVGKAAPDKDIARALEECSASLSVEVRKRLTANAAKERAERQLLYAILKLCAEDSLKDALFAPFGIKGQKKRKQTLVNILWLDFSTTTKADLSADVVAQVIDRVVVANAAKLAAGKLLDGVDALVAEQGRRDERCMREYLYRVLAEVASSAMAALSASMRR